MKPMTCRLIFLQSFIVLLLAPCVSAQTSGHLYIEHMNADHPVVFDTATRKAIANIGGFARVQGVWAVPELARVYAPVTGDHEVATVDSQTLRTVAKIGPINYPDGIAYAAPPQTGLRVG